MNEDESVKNLLNDLIRYCPQYKDRDIGLINELLDDIFDQDCVTYKYLRDKLYYLWENRVKGL
ncbi:MAG: hypothetical protein E7290_15715 [Lachnospiraceae bacterium]|nr:hypothetical protein [Lachnospiraceae bacterium]